MKKILSVLFLLVSLSVMRAQMDTYGETTITRVVPVTNFTSAAITLPAIDLSKYIGQLTVFAVAAPSASLGTNVTITAITNTTITLQTNTLTTVVAGVSTNVTIPTATSNNVVVGTSTTVTATSPLVSDFSVVVTLTSTNPVTGVNDAMQAMTNTITLPALSASLMHYTTNLDTAANGRWLTATVTPTATSVGSVNVVVIGHKKYQ